MVNKITVIYIRKAFQKWVVNVNQNKGLFSREQSGCRGPIHGGISDYWSARRNLSHNTDRFQLWSASIVQILLNSAKMNEEKAESMGQKYIQEQKRV